MIHPPAVEVTRFKCLPAIHHSLFSIEAFSHVPCLMCHFSLIQIERLIFWIFYTIGKTDLLLSPAARLIFQLRMPRSLLISASLALQQLHLDFFVRCERVLVFQQQVHRFILLFFTVISGSKF